VDTLRGFGVVCSGTTNQKHYIAQRDVKGKTRGVNLGATSATKCEAAREEAVLGEPRKGNDQKKADGVLHAAAGAGGRRTS
jgi:hypothetical protein